MNVVVVGGGPAGVAAALQARELGASVTLVERGRVGGTSLNTGPAPVRTLARAARLVRDTRSWETFGLRGAAPTLDLAAALANVNRVSHHSRDTTQLAQRMRAAGIEVVEGAAARLADERTVTVADGRSWTADRIVLAVGGRPGRLPIPGAELALTYADLRSLQSLPARVAVIGGADTGCQIASILADFGSEVTLLEYAGRLLPRSDADVSRAVEHAFSRKGMRVVTGAGAQELERDGAGIRVRFTCPTGPAEVSVDTVFMAVGWPANVDGLGMEAAGVTVADGYVRTSDWLQTDAAHIYAAGDVDGHSMLVPSARLEGRVAAENAVLGGHRPVYHDIVPTGSFTDPEYGSVGLSEEAARARYDVVVSQVRYADLVRPLVDAHPEGFCKLIVERRQRLLLGAHVVGEYSAEVIQVVAAAMTAHLPVERLAELQLSFPTYAEGLVLAAQQVAAEMGVTRLPRLWGDMGRMDDVVDG